MQGSVNVQGAAQVQVVNALTTAREALSAATEAQSTGDEALGLAQEHSATISTMQETLTTAANTANEALNIAKGIEVATDAATIQQMQEDIATALQTEQVAEDANDSAQSAVETAAAVKAIVDGMDAVSTYYTPFEAADWQKEDVSPNGAYVIRVSKGTHMMLCKSTMVLGRERMNAVLHKLRVVKDRNCGDFIGGEDLSYARKAIINAEIRALRANQRTPGSYPVAENGHTLLTWAQIQYFLLENVLVSADEAAEKAAEKGFDWKDRNTIDAELDDTIDVWLERLMAAAYVPALGGAHTVFDDVCTVDLLRGLHFRRVRFSELDGSEQEFKDTWSIDCVIGCDADSGIDQDGENNVERVEGESEGGVPLKDWYELDGRCVEDTWITTGTEVYIEEGTQDLILASDAPYAGDVAVME